MYLPVPVKHTRVLIHPVGQRTLVSAVGPLTAPQRLHIFTSSLCDVLFNQPPKYLPSTENTSGVIAPSEDAAERGFGEWGEKKEREFPALLQPKPQNREVLQKLGVLSAS